MKDLLAVIAKGLVDDPDSVSVEADAPNEEGTVVYHIHVAENDMGRIIGKQGRIAKAIRTIARSAAIRSEEKIMVEIDLLTVHNRTKASHHGRLFYTLLNIKR